MTSTGQDNSTGTLDPETRDFVLWCLEAMDLHVVSDAGVYTLQLPPAAGNGPRTPPHPYAALVGRRFAFVSSDARSGDSGGPVEVVTYGSPLMAWLLGELRSAAWPLHAAVRQQPNSVHELTEHLFAQYSVDGGHIHLSGCSLEDRPFLRLTYWNQQDQDGRPTLRHVHGTSDGDLVSEDTLSALSLEQLVELPGRPPHLAPEVLANWGEIIRRKCAQQMGNSAAEPLAATLIWCKYAEGRLTFSIGGSSVDLPFSGWAQLFALRRILPPPYCCPLSGISSYHLAATDDGRITAAEAIGTCTESGRRVLEGELKICAATQRKVLPEYLQTCPVTGEKVLQRVLEPCTLCQQSVSPRSLKSGLCSACRSLAPVSKDDPRMARVLDAYPRLDGWKRWKMSETQAVHVLVGASAWRRILVVLDKQTLDVIHVAASGRLSTRWTEATPVQRADWLG